MNKAGWYLLTTLRYIAIFSITQQIKQQIIAVVLVLRLLRLAWNHQTSS